MLQTISYKVKATAPLGTVALFSLTGTAGEGAFSSGKENQKLGLN